MAKQNRRPAYVQNATGNNIGGDSGGASGTRVEPSFNPKAPMPLLPRRRQGVAASNLSYVSGAVAEGLRFALPEACSRELRGKDWWWLMQHVASSRNERVC